MNALGPLTFGFDIGIASVGWAVLSETRIVDLGVRCFDKAETADKGESLNLARRTARLLRRRLRRRAWRLTKLARCLRRHGVLQDAKYFSKEPSFGDSTWVLRDAARSRLLQPIEWARVIFHLCKHRGFHWISKAEALAADGDAASESGRVKKGLAETSRMMREKGYETAAQMVLAEFPESQRNKRGEYSKALSRVLLDQEFRLLFERQRGFGNTLASAALEAEVLGSGDRRSGLFWAQKPPLAGADLLKMLGKCTFEREEYRAPKASFTAERHVWLTRLNNLRMTVDGITRPLDESERALALALPYVSGEKFSYKNLRTALEKAGLPKSFRFAGLSYPSERQREENKAKDPEGEVLIKLPAWHELRLAFKRADSETIWQKLSTDSLAGRPEQLDQIAWVLSVYKDDEEVERELRKLALPDAETSIEILLGIRFDKFHALSIKALRQIVPKMERGKRYDEAVAAIPEYAHHSQPESRRHEKRTLLPSFYRGADRSGKLLFNENLDIPRNPVVLRALNQARKVLNALVKVYGSPAQVNIEMARDLSRPLDERKKVKRLQDEFRERNEASKEHFASCFERKPTGIEHEKWLLFREQHSKCAYSLLPLDANRVVNDPTYVEIDHALPYSRSYDDSKNNKVLVLKVENQRKGNRTPFEYLTSFEGGENSARWREFVGFVESNKAYRQAKRSRLLRKNYGKDEAKSFMERNLNDTRYICKFFKNLVEQHLQLAETSDSKRCVVLNGQLTSFLRARWGLLKVREESDRHHALDSVVVAACDHGMVKRLSDYARRRELESVSSGFVDLETGEIIDGAMLARLEKDFPAPWEHFRHELEARLKLDDLTFMRETLSMLGNYDESALGAAKPLFVSRAPQRRNGGAAHKETIYSQPPDSVLAQEGAVKQRVALTSLSIKDLDRLVDPDRNERLYTAIRERMEEFGGKADKAFAADKPLYKPDKFGALIGPIVRCVNVRIDKMSGIPIRAGIAKNDTMLRVDVFQSKKDKRFHLVPVYVHHRVTGLPNRAIVAFKDETDWTEIDDSFGFLFSLCPNDLIEITQKGKAAIRGYYASCHRGTGNVNLWAHDRSSNVGKAGAIEGLGVKTAVSLVKLNADVLGNIFPAPSETRRDLA
ncbi:MAG: type II CRISPR RNA-guided endonuclease Cas9 [Betaproteobacteria bacterium]|nr:MAG: type II CRISPR RNA-guided endonuclease Cas9 [Betaproteobacteria bacterium]